MRCLRAPNPQQIFHPTPCLPSGGAWNPALRYYHRRGALCDLNMTDQVRLATAPVRFGFAAKANSYPSFARGFDGFELYRRIADLRYRVGYAPLK